MGNFTNKLDRALKITHAEEYHRSLTSTYLSAIEWRNVEMSEEFSAYLKENNSLVYFPYFRQIATLWGILFKSLRSNVKKQSFWQIITSEDFLMDLFITVFTTMEMLPKGIISLLLFPFSRKQNQTEMQQHIATYYQDYCKKLQLIPFYEHDYKTTRQELEKKYQECTNKTWGDWVSWTITSLELRARRWISKPLAHWYSQDGNVVTRTTDVLVKYKSDKAENADVAKQEFLDAFSKVQEQAGIAFDKHDSNLHPRVVSEDIYLKEPHQEKGKTTYTVYARIKVPRYKEFIPVIRWLDEQNIQIRRIAGHDHIQIKCISERLNHSLTVNAQKPMYTYTDDIHKNRRFFMFDTPVRSLKETMNQIEKDEQTKLEFIHNY